MAAETRAPATVRRHVATVAYMHCAAGLGGPTKHEAVRLAVTRINGENGTRHRVAAPHRASRTARCSARHPLHADDVARIVKRRAKAAGVDAGTVARLSGHSERVAAFQDMVASDFGVAEVM